MVKFPKDGKFLVNLKDGPASGGTKWQLRTITTTLTLIITLSNVNCIIIQLNNERSKALDLVQVNTKQ